MPRWTRPLLAWATDRLLRPRPRALSVAVGYERGGAPKWDSPVPWTADAAVVEVRLLARPGARRKADFALRAPHGTFPADALRADADDACRACFRVPVPPASGAADVLWRGRVLATVPLGVVTPESFVAGLGLGECATAVRYGDTTATATAFVADGCDGLFASAVLRAPGGLQPLAELGLTVRFREDTTGRACAVPVRPSAAQLARGEALATAACPLAPHGPGVWWVSWHAGARELATRRVAALPRERFEAAVRVPETRFALVDFAGVGRSAKLPVLAGVARAGPCFVLSGGEPGAVGRVRFELVAVPNCPFAAPQVTAVEAVVGDAPAPFVPVLLDAAELGQFGEFELRLNDRLLGVASLRPVPSAHFTSEGGFAPPDDFAWSSAAEEELAARLRRLG